ncbi:SMP-30/gluconolactonase/LRE family protein [Rhodococcoides trifolii]|uniref:SMP-30/gluconolactonase/LRE family protein n=1 Tax=Rhodococcoides trifolii TaxID=908250 RepID=UPI00166928FB|nr:SMP-30/gluconolactonase/LRE family protein [Rhodococcus trifolii]
MDADAQVGEGPFWDEREAILHWVDIPRGLIHRTDGHTTTTHVPTTVGAAIPRSSGPGYVVAIGEGFGTVVGDELEVTHPILPRDHRMNDAKCDARGRLWAGSCHQQFSAGAGVLHVLDSELGVRTAATGFSLPNGLGWSPANDTFYLVDSVEHTVHAWDFDLDTGAVDNQRTLARFEDADGLPDGLCIDEDGCIWVAMWGGGSVRRLSPAGVELSRIDVPVQQPSSCAFAGPELDVLIVTSARDGLQSPSRIDGSVLAVHELGARGVPVARYAG